MDDMESKMGAILNNPEMMQKIMAMAQTLNQSSGQKQEEKAPPKDESSQQAGGFNMPDIDISMLQKLSGLAKQSGVDRNQQSLLKALHPYLSRQRIAKLEKAMRAARMASVASSVLGSQGIQSLLGR